MHFMRFLDPDPAWLPRGGKCRVGNTLAFKVKSYYLVSCRNKSRGSNLKPLGVLSGQKRYRCISCPPCTADVLAVATDDERAYQ